MIAATAAAGLAVVATALIASVVTRERAAAVLREFERRDISRDHRPRLPAGPLTAAGAAAAGVVGFRFAGVAGSLAAIAAVAIAPRMERRRRARRLERRIQKHLAEAVALIGTAMRSGRSLLQAIKLSGDELDPALGSTFGRLVDRAELGDPMDEAIDAWAAEVGGPDARLVAGVLKLHRRTGGSLSTTLEDLAGTLRSRRSAAREVESLTAQARLSATILGACFPSGSSCSCRSSHVRTSRLRTRRPWAWPRSESGSRCRVRPTCGSARSSGSSRDGDHGGDAGGGGGARCSRLDRLLAEGRSARPYRHDAARSRPAGECVRADRPVAVGSAHPRLRANFGPNGDRRGSVGSARSGRGEGGRGASTLVVFGVFLGPASLPVALVAWTIPDLVLARIARRATRAADREIPVLLDLLAVATSAGLPPQLAFRRAVECAEGPLAEALREVVQATDLGGRWRDELRAAGDRLELADLRRLTGALARTEAVGSSLSEEISRLAADVREMRRGAAAQRARTAPVKMLFPLVFLVLPAFLLLTVVPVLLTTVRSIA